MQVSTFLITDGGPHPADKWAEISSNTIVDTLLVDGNPNDGSLQAVTNRLAKRELCNKLFAILIGHHAGVQQAERTVHASITKAAAAAGRVIQPLDPSPHMTVMEEVNAAFAASPFKDHFEKPQVQAVVAQIIGQHTADVMHIERRWHHDRLSSQPAKGA